MQPTALSPATSATAIPDVSLSDSVDTRTEVKISLPHSARQDPTDKAMGPTIQVTADSRQDVAVTLSNPAVTSSEKGTRMEVVLSDARQDIHQVVPKDTNYTISLTDTRTDVSLTLSDPDITRMELKFARSESNTLQSSLILTSSNKRASETRKRHAEEISKLEEEVKKWKTEVQEKNRKIEQMEALTISAEQLETDSFYSYEWPLNDSNLSE